MKQQENRRISADNEYAVNNNMNIKELKEILELEKREDNIQIIKELMFDKMFAKAMFICGVALSVLFVILGILNS